MRFGSVCSGIEAASVAWSPLGWTPSFYSEIEAFPRAVLAHHHPQVPLHGDFTTIEAGKYEPIDLLVGGTPCQSFSVAGLRGGLDDDRGNLALEFLKLAQRLRPRWVVWENVPGVLSSNGGRDFGAILGGLGVLGYGFAYRVLDAQFFGVAQRRRRVFLVGYAGDWRRPAAVLFEREGLSGHPAPRREAGKGPAWGVAHSLRAGGFDASEDGTGRGTPLVPVVSPALKARDYKGPSSDGDGDGDGAALIPVCFSSKDYGADAELDLAPTLRAGGHDGSHANAGVPPAVVLPNAVRRLTPRECERLQGFPDGYTDVPWRGRNWTPDGPRYKALGNSMAVPVMAWIGRRIAAVDALIVDSTAGAGANKAGGERLPRPPALTTSHGGADR